MNGFFNFRKLVVGVMAATCFMGFQSCLDDDDDYPYSKVLPNALVTVKPVDDGSYFLQLDSNQNLLWHFLKLLMGDKSHEADDFYPFHASHKESNHEAMHRGSVTFHQYSAGNVLQNTNLYKLLLHYVHKQMSSRAVYSFSPLSAVLPFPVYGWQLTLL